MAPRPAIASMLPLLFVGFGAWAGDPIGVITGEVIDGSNGDPIFGAVIGDFTDALPIYGSFAGDGVYFIRNVPEGPRNIKVTAPGYAPEFDTVEVFPSDPAVLNLQMQPNISLNTAEISFLINNPFNPDGPEMYVLPPLVYAFQDGILLRTASARSGRKYRISGIPDGDTTFLAFSPPYNIRSKKVSLSENRIVQVTMQVDAPAGRGPIAGSLDGVVTDSGIPIVATVYATFPFEGSPVTVSTVSAAETGVYVIDLLPPVATEVEAFALSGTDRTPAPPIATPTVVGGVVTTQNLMVVPFDPMTANFIPITLSPTATDMDEDDNRVLLIDEFTVVDSDNNFSTDHTIVVHPGLDYTRSNILPGSTQIDLAPDWHGSIIVPVSMDDGLNTGDPLLLTITVNPVDDATVYVDFDAGLPLSGGGTGSLADPLLTVFEALSAVTAPGTILIQGVASSTEPPLTINQDVTLQIDGSDADDLVRIAPSVARQADAASPAKSGFVTRSGRPSRNHRSGT